jgi:SAM-dependent methyltransferase
MGGGDAVATAPGAAARYRAARSAHWNRVATQWRRWPGLGGAYHRRLERVYTFLVPSGSRVLELGCGRGDLLAALAPADGIGVDFASEMVRQAAERHPHLRFLEADAQEPEGLEGTFDAILLSDLVNDVWDVQRLFEYLLPLTTPRTRIILNVHSRLWEPPLAVAQRLGLAQPTLDQNWLTPDDIENLLELAGLRLIRRWQEVLLPLPIPLLAPLANRFLVRFWPFRQMAMCNFFVARPAPRSASREPLVSVVVPARNEAGNIAAVFGRTPEMGAGTELVFVEGHSQDETYAAIERGIAAHPGRRVKLLRQKGEGKGDAVRAGFAEASGEVLMILDADLTVPPEDLPRFFAALRSGRGELVNGVRLIYPMERQAMHFANLVANKLFGLAFSWLLGQPIRDTLCGTKAIGREDYEQLAANRSHFGEFDPFGDFDLLFGAARLDLEIVEVPIRYRERTYGSSNIRRWRHGWLLLRMCVVAAARLKFV